MNLVPVSNDELKMILGEKEIIIFQLLKKLKELEINLDASIAEINKLREKNG